MSCNASVGLINSTRIYCGSLIYGGIDLPFCPKCGIAVAEDDNFCRACGKSLERGKMTVAGRARTQTHYDETFKTTPESECNVVPEPEEYEYGKYGPGAFPRHVLTTGEVPLFETRPLQWISMLGPVVLAILTLVVFILIYASFHKAPILYVMGVFLVIEALWIFTRWLQWRSIIYAATNRRVLCQTGIISKSYVDCPLGKVQTVYLEIPVLGRLNDFGTVRVATAGESRVEIEWRNVREPMQTQRILNEIIEKYERGGG